MKKITIIILLSLVSIAFGISTSFNGGELCPALRYRVDLDAQSKGVETLENMTVKPQGAAFRRPGTMYVSDTDNPVDVLIRTEIGHPTSDPTKIHIYTAAQLQLVGSGGDYPRDGDYELMNDIDLTGVDWRPLNYSDGVEFIGTFDGRYYTISNMTITVDNVVPDNTYQGVGLFSQIRGGTIRRLILTDASITTSLSGQVTGLMVGSASTSTNTFIDCYAQGTIHAIGNNGLFGGFAGLMNSGANLTRCGVDIAITGTGSLSSVGGFVYYASSNNVFTDCYAIGSINCGINNISSAGGFVSNGLYRTGVIEQEYINCYSAVSVTGTEYLDPSRLGGFLGYLNTTSTADGEYTASFWDNDKMNEGAITGRSEDLYDCGRLDTTSDEGDLDGVTKSTTTLMQTQSTFTDWNFDHDANGVWQIETGDYPRHQWHETYATYPHYTYILTSLDNDNIHLISFEYSTDDAYVIEAGNQYLRFYRDQ